MAMFLEIFLIVVPILIVFAVFNEFIPVRFANYTLRLSFVLLVIELIISWLKVFKFISLSNIDSIFIGDEWWHLVAGPVVFLLYVYVMTELSIYEVRQTNKKSEKGQVT
ncbi:NADH dehydrogenase [Vibrio neptunius]